MYENVNDTFPFTHTAFGNGNNLIGPERLSKVCFHIRQYNMLFKLWDIPVLCNYCLFLKLRVIQMSKLQVLKYKLVNKIGSKKSD